MSTLKVTDIKAKDGTSALSIADSTGKVSLATGSDLALQGGKVFAPNGIVFSSTELTTDDASTTTRTESSNLLDDYEEGTWTPTVSSVSVGSGKYLKIGDLVFIECVITANSLSTSTIDGLPFSLSTASGYGGFYFGSTWGCDVLDSNGVHCRIIAKAPTSQIEFINNALNANGTAFTITTIASGIVRIGITGVTRFY